jgi:hypothetical protein
MSGGRYWVKRLDELPLVPTDDPNDFDWYPVQHHLGLGAFGVNGFGGDTATMLVAEHDESGSGQEELYVVVEGDRPLHDRRRDFPGKRGELCGRPRSGGHPFRDRGGGQHAAARDRRARRLRLPHHVET